MKAIAVQLARATPDALEGRIACHDVRDGAGKVAINKGQLLDAAASARLLTLPWPEVHLLELDPGDIHEEPAASRLAAAACGVNVEVKGYSGGQGRPGAQGRGPVSGNAAAPPPGQAPRGLS